MDMMELAFETAADAIFLVDGQGRILRSNRACEKLLGYTPEELQGRTIEELLPQGLRELHIRHRADFMAHPRPRPMGTGLKLGALRRDGSELPVDVTLNQAATPQGLVVVAVLRDISERVRAEAEREALIRELQEALGEVKALRGLLPICSYCKRIRDSEGAWQPIEVFVRDRSEAEFSHTICPACLAENFPEYKLPRQ